MNEIKKLSKLVKIKYHENSIRHYEKLLKSNEGNKVEVNEITEDVFSYDDLIDGRYHFYSRYRFTEDLNPVLECKSISLLNKDKVQSIILRCIPDLLSKKLDDLDIHSYKLKDGRYLHVAKYVDCTGKFHEDKECGDNYLDSKISLYDRIIKLINHLRYEHYKKAKS